MGFRKDFEDYIEDNPFFTSYPFPMGIIGTFILAAFPVCLFFIFPSIESQQIKIFLHGLLNPITLGMSYFGSAKLIEKISNKSKLVLSILILLPCVAVFGAALHLHLPVHMSQSFLDKFFIFLPGCLLGLIFSYLWIYLSRDLRKK